MVDKEEEDIEVGRDKFYPHDVNRSAIGHQKYHDKPAERLRNMAKPDLESFARGMHVLYEAVFTQEQPDVIIAPARGGAPIVWALEVIAEKNEVQMPIVLNPPVGTNTNMYDWGKSQGVSGQEKIAILRTEFDTLHEIHKREIDNGRKGIQKITLIDEAKSGGTITQHASHLFDLQQNWKEKGWEFEISIIMVHDSRNPNVKLDHAVSALLSNRMGKAQKIGLNNPFMDVREVLPLILRQSPDVRLSRTGEDYKDWELLEVWEDPELKKIFKDKIKEVIKKKDIHL